MRLISLNIAYVSGAVDGETIVETTLLRAGKSVDFVHVVVKQSSKIRISVMKDAASITYFTSPLLHSCRLTLLLVPRFSAWVEP